MTLIRITLGLGQQCDLSVEKVPQLHCAVDVHAQPGGDDHIVVRLSVERRREAGNAERDVDHVPPGTTPTLKTSWDDHYMLPAFLGFLSFALGNVDILAQYRTETGDRWETTGAEFALQRFSDFCERAHFGTPATLEAA